MLLRAGANDSNDLTAPVALGLKNINKAPKVFPCFPISSKLARRLAYTVAVCLAAFITFSGTWSIGTPGAFFAM